MTNPPSLTLCQELHRLAPGWHDTQAYMYDTGTKIAVQYAQNLETKPGWWWYEGIQAWPLYDTDYLLKKLPAYTSVYKQEKGTACAEYYEHKNAFYSKEDNTPAEALIRLACTLLKEGKLKP